MCRIFTFLIFLWVVTPSALAQSTLSEKEKQLPFIPNKSQRIEMLLEISELYLDSLPQKSIDYSNEIIELIGKPSKKNKRRIEELALAHLTKSRAHFLNENWDESKRCAKECINWSKKADFLYAEENALDILEDLDQIAGAAKEGSWWQRQKKKMNNLGVGEAIKKTSSGIKKGWDVKKIEYIRSAAEKFEKEHQYTKAIEKYAQLVEIYGKRQAFERQKETQEYIQYLKEKQNTYHVCCFLLGAGKRQQASDQELK